MESRLQNPILWAIFLIFITALFIFLTFLVTKNKNQPFLTKKSGSCLILEEKYCLQAERIQIKINGVTNTFLAFNLPPKVPFFAPEDAQLLDKVKESGDPFSGFRAILREPNSGGAYVFIGLEFDDMIQVKNPKKGSVIGYSNSTGTTNYGAAVLMTKIKTTSEGSIIDETLLKNLFHLK